MKRILCILASALLVATMVTGCKGKNTPTSVPNGNDKVYSSGSPTTRDPNSTPNGSTSTAGKTQDPNAAVKITPAPSADQGVGGKVTDEPTAEPTTEVDVSASPEGNE